MGSEMMMKDLIATTTELPDPRAKSYEGRKDNPRAYIVELGHALYNAGGYMLADSVKESACQWLAELATEILENGAPSAAASKTLLSITTALEGMEQHKEVTRKTLQQIILAPNIEENTRIAAIHAHAKNFGLESLFKDARSDATHPHPAPNMPATQQQRRRRGATPQAECHPQ
ncbi:MAG: hypothetical protein ABTQ34_04370 [Bdellovibrionales bacterium]